MKTAHFCQTQVFFCFGLHNKQSPNGKIRKWLSFSHTEQYLLKWQIVNITPNSFYYYTLRHHLRCTFPRINHFQLRSLKQRVRTRELFLFSAFENGLVRYSASHEFLSEKIRSAGRTVVNWSVIIATNPTQPSVEMLQWVLHVRMW